LGEWRIAAKAYKEDGLAGTGSLSLTVVPGHNIAEVPMYINGGYFDIAIDSSMGNGTVTADFDAAFPETTITLTLTPAAGYFIKAGTAAYHDGSDHGIAGPPYTFTMPAADVTVRAEFDLTYIPCTVTFNSDGGSTVPPQIVEKGGTVTQPEDPARSGSYFGGWYTDSSLSTKYDFGNTPVTGGTTIYAKWLAETDADEADFGSGAIIELPITISSASDWTTALSTINGTAGNYIVTVSGDITGLMPGSITNASTVSLRGGGSLALGSNGSLISVGPGSTATLILRGPTLKGKAGNTTTVVGIHFPGAKFIMESGTITGNTIIDIVSSDGGGVSVSNNGTFIMNGGTISGNASNNIGQDSGGGVLVTNYGTFEMNGGTIRGNTTVERGGGVLVTQDGTFTMNGGTIRDNTVISDTLDEPPRGGGVATASRATFTMNGGTITGNTVFSNTQLNICQGGGMYVENSTTFTMNGGTISGNTAAGGFKSFGGGVCVEVSHFFDNTGFTMTGGFIGGNTADYGGGAALLLIEGWGGSLTFTKTGGTIYGANTGGHSNYADANGWGHAVCKLIVTGTTIEDATFTIKYRDATAGPGDNIDAVSGAGLN
jgi:hypothetical protein